MYLSLTLDHGALTLTAERARVFACFVNRYRTFFLHGARPDNLDAATAEPIQYVDLIRRWYGEITCTLD